MEPLFYILLFVLGACFGSFLCCQARRLRIRSKSLKEAKTLQKRSTCLSCKKPIKWYDNLPIVSWLILRGKCRYCRHKIGIAEFLSELGVGLAFVMVGTTFDSTTTNVLSWAIFLSTLLLVLVFSFLAIYDGLYGELPSLGLGLSILQAAIIATLKITQQLQTQPFSADLIIQPILAVVILGGLYLLLLIISKGKWVGDGDWLLGVAIALALGSPWLALFVLFLSNITACLVMLPAVKGNYHQKIYFGPFLVLAFVVVLTFANFLISMI